MAGRRAMLFLGGVLTVGGRARGALFGMLPSSVVAAPSPSAAGDLPG